MKRQRHNIAEMRPEYDFSGGVRGKYIKRLAKGSNVVVLDKDVASVFPDSVSVNEALRAIAGIVRSRRVKRSARRLTGRSSDRL